jgi:DNA-binding IclR family transcriptional regulator
LTFSEYSEYHSGMSEHAKPPSPPTARVLAILEALADAPSSGLSLSEVARTVGLGTSTAASILATMDEAQYAERLPNRAYRLGPGLLKVLGGLRSRFPMLGAADEELSRLSALVGRGCSLARINTDDLEVVFTSGSVDEFDTRVGQRMPLHPPHGSIAVAWRPQQSIDDWLFDAPDPLTPDEIATLRNTLAEINERGYAVYNVKRDVQTMVQQIRQLLGTADNHTPTEVLRRLLLSAVGGIRIYTNADLADRRRRPVSYVIAPVFGPDQQPRYLVSLHIMSDAVTADDLDHYIEALLQSSTSLTKLGGGQRPDSSAAG